MRSFFTLPKRTAFLTRKDPVLPRITSTRTPEKFNQPRPFVASCLQRGWNFFTNLSPSKSLHSSSLCRSAFCWRQCMGPLQTKNICRNESHYQRQTGSVEHRQSYNVASKVEGECSISRDVIESNTNRF